MSAFRNVTFTGRSCLSSSATAAARRASGLASFGLVSRKAISNRLVGDLGSNGRLLGVDEQPSRQKDIRVTFVRIRKPPSLRGVN